MPDSLRQFFDSYQNAWNSLSGEVIAAHYQDPVSILDGDGYEVYQSQDDLVAKFNANCAAFAELGYLRSHYTACAYIESGEAGATVDLAWQVELADGMRSFGTTYTCLQLSEWRIVCAIAYASA